jgi:very-short-patch-repair endonuclease
MVYIYYDGPRRLTKARELRRTQTKAEKLLWDHVRNRQLGGFKIRRQHFLNEIIIDFYCSEKRLCIEIDGPYHNVSPAQESDKLRDDELEGHGFTVLRFQNDEVLFDMNRVLNDILKTLHSLSSSGSSPLNHDSKLDLRFLQENQAAV